MEDPILDIPMYQGRICIKVGQATAPPVTDLQGNGTIFEVIIGYSVQFLNKIEFFEKFVKIKINNLLMSFSENKV